MSIYRTASTAYAELRRRRWLCRLLVCKWRVYDITDVGNDSKESLHYVCARCGARASSLATRTAFSKIFEDLRVLHAMGKLTEREYTQERLKAAWRTMG